MKTQIFFKTCQAKLAFAIVALLATVTPAVADEKLAGIACRSVHLGYTTGPAVALYNEVNVESSAEGTYFCVLGFNKGYFGIQEQSKGKKVVIFSVWDPASGQDPKKVDPAKQVKLLHKGEGVRIGRFGNEGTGGQSFLDYDWKLGQTYRFLVTAKPDGDDRTAFSGYIFLNDKKEWKHLVTFSTITGGKLLDGAYSFIEDFKRNKVSTTFARKATYGNGWAKNEAGEWKPITTARFTGDSNPAVNIDAGLKDGQFFLVTGGDTKNTTTKLREKIALPDATRTAPADIPGMK